MPIDTSIIGRLQPFNFVQSDPFERAQKRLQLQALMQQTQDRDVASREIPAFLKLLQGKPAELMDMGQIDPSMSQFGSLETQPAVQPNPMVAYGMAAGSRSPMMQKIGAQGMAEMPKLEAQRLEKQEMRDWRTQESQLARDARAADAQAARDARMEELKRRSEDARASQQERLQAQKEMREMQIQSQREFRAMAGSMRQPPAPSLTTIVDPADPTKMITVDARAFNPSTRAGVVGVSGKEPGALKREEQATTGREQVSGIVTNLRDMYTQLGEGGGIVDSTKGALSNIPARLSSTGAGQFGGQLLGTKNQKLRDTVEQQRPLLLNAIKNATGMSAKQMDSNAELKLYLAAATDPTKDIAANLEALDNLERLFGQSAKGGAAPSKAAPAALPQGWSVKVK